MGLEPTPELYIDHLVQIFREVWRVLRKDGTLWVNIGDSYAANRSYQVTDTKWRDVGNTKGSKIPSGLKPKDLVLIPFRLALALQADGWWLRSDIIWHKPNAMPSSVKDRPTTDFEHVFLCSKSKRYYYDYEAIMEPIKESSIQKISQKTFDQQKGGDKDYRHGVNPNRSMRKTIENFAKNNKGFRNKRTVWTIPTQPSSLPHYATFPEKLVEPMILAGSKPGDIVFDPFMGMGTTGVVAKKLNRRWVGIDANADYCERAIKRIMEA